MIIQYLVIRIVKLKLKYYVQFMVNLNKLRIRILEVMAVQFAKIVKVKIL